MSTLYTLELIAFQAAIVFAGKDWHSLTGGEYQLVESLEKNGHIIPNSPPNGFVGKVNEAKVPTPPAAALVFDRDKGSISVRKNELPSGSLVDGVVDINHVQFDPDLA